MERIKNFKDQWITNEDGSRFVFTVEMQRRLSQANLPVDPASLEQLPEEGIVYHQEEAHPEMGEPSESVTEIDTMFDIRIDPMTGKYIGRVKWYNIKKGYGFIIRGGGEEIFFHKSGTAAEMANLVDGQWVLYDVEDTTKGPEAMDVELYSGELE